jgi:hypothetical protein
VRAAASMKKKLMINMGRWGLGTYPERKHLRTAESARFALGVSASREEAPQLALSRDYESGDLDPTLLTLHRLDTMGSAH